MADRFLLKKFASETNDVGQFGSFQSTGGNIGDGVKTTDPDLIQSLPAWKAGWGNAVDNGLLLPRLEEMNGVQRVFAEMLWNQWRDGITFWQAGAPVKALQSIVMYQTGDEKPKLYINKTGVNGTNPPPQDTDNWEPLKDSGSCGEIGDIGFAPLGIDESLNLRRYLNGQVISQSQFVSFTNKVKSAIALYPNLAATETNWQAEKTNSKLGQCGKFVVDDTAGTIRLPCVVNAQGLVDLALIGMLKSESLPNLTGNACVVPQNDLVPSGVFARSDKTIGAWGGSGTTAKALDFDASRSSSAYQDGAPVQQEAVQYPYYIQVATGIEETLPAIREYNINTPFFFGQSMYSDVAPDNASWLASNGQYNAKSVYPDYYDWLVEQMNAGVSGFVSSTAAYTDYDFVINTTDQTFRLPLLNGKENIPDYSMASALSNTGTITINKKGWVNYTAIRTNQVALVTISGVSYRSGSSATNDHGSMMMPVNKGDTVTGAGNADTSYFIPAKGHGTLYYYVGDTVQDASLINAGAVLGQLANKADVDLNNVSAIGKSLASGWAAPSDRYINLTLLASGNTYTAPANGYFRLLKSGNAGAGIQYVGAYDKASNDVLDVSYVSSTYGGMLNFYARKGQVIKINYTVSGSTSYFKFVYAEGDQ